MRDPGGGRVTAFHRTPGDEPHPGLGWYGMIVQGEVPGCDRAEDT